MSDGRGTAPGRELRHTEVREGAEVFVVDGVRPPWTGTVHAVTVTDACVVEDLGATSSYRWVPHRWLRTIEPEAVPVLAGHQARERLRAGGRTGVRIPGWSNHDADQPRTGEEVTVMGVRCTVVSWDGSVAVVDPVETVVMTLADLVDRELFGDAPGQNLTGLLGVPGVRPVDETTTAAARSVVDRLAEQHEAAKVPSSFVDGFEHNTVAFRLSREQMLDYGLVAPTDAERAERDAATALFRRLTAVREGRERRARRLQRVAGHRRRGTGPCRKPGAPCGCDHGDDD